MTRPDASDAPNQGEPPRVSPALSIPVVETLTKRADFLLAARALRHGSKGLMLQGRDRKDTHPATRVGYTCSKKVGNAVRRNAAKRRLREMAREVLTTQGHPGWDYVLIGRAKETEDRLFTDLLDDLRYCLRKIHDKANP